MVEFIQNYGIWILLIGGMFLMHRLGFGCCGGHRHGQGLGHGHGEDPKAEPKPADPKAVAETKPETLTSASGPAHRGCH